MPRLPFDPSRAAGAPRAPADSAQARPLSVSQLATLIDNAMRDHLPAHLRVLGEIGQFRQRTHWYFDLKDADAVISCVMWQSAARKLPFTPATGRQVLAVGRVEFYPPQGRTQFMVDRLEPVGEGALDLALKKLVEDARALGWLDDARKRAPRLLPRRVAVVTSAGGAALQDVRDTAARRCPCVRLSLVDVRVQGPAAAAEIARALRRLARLHDELGIDTIILTRGGGSMEDLWAFNDRELARAIVESPVPVVAAIGHETDITLAELVADVRAATPTQAAMRALPDADALRHQLDASARRMAALLSRRVRAGDDRLAAVTRHARLVGDHLIRSRSHHLERLAARIERVRPANLHAQRAARLDVAAARLAAAARALLARHDLTDARARLHAALARALHDRRVSVESAARNLDLVGPVAVLKRGFSVTLTPDGRAVRSIADAAPGQLIRTRLPDGAFDSRVLSPDATDTPCDAPLRPVSPAGRREVQRPPSRSAQRSKSPDHQGQGGLFS